MTAEARAPRAYPRARTVFRVRGVPVRIDWSLLLIAALVGWVFTGLLGDSEGLQGASTLVLGIAAAAATVLFFASVLIHELGHAWTSLDRGIPVAGITLFLLGGITEATAEARRARDDFLIVAAGPFMSLTLAAAFGLAHEGLVGLDVAALDPAAVVAAYLGWANLALAVFNLLPAFPLDGGRLLRSVLWALGAGTHRSTRLAARVGQAFALALGGFGIWALTSGTGLGGIWELLIALFLFKGAADAASSARLRERLSGRTAGQVMGSAPPPLAPETRLHDAAVSLRQQPSLLWPVGEPLSGVVRLADLEAVDRRQWSVTSLAAVAAAPDGQTATAQEDLDDAVARMVDAPAQMLLVLDERGAVRGLLTPSLVADLSAAARR